MEGKEKRTIDDDPNVYKVLAMLFEPIVIREYEKMSDEGQRNCRAIFDGHGQDSGAECGG